MDIFCKNCAEPWEMDSLHDMTNPETGNLLNFDAAREAFYAQGCRAFGTSCNIHPEAQRPLKAMIAGEMQALLGDDIDGLAAMMEDFEYGGLV